jgi:ABC-type transporter Mla maintaining outer membrane lipid asymmetry permease subunit MlaE
MGVVVSMITLYVYFNVFGLLGSFVVVRLSSTSGEEYFTEPFRGAHPR